MKTFSEYLMESKKKFNFTVKLTFKPDNDLMDKVESALGRYDLDAIGKPRSLPISKIDKHFPGLTAPETYAFDVTVNYPATANFVRSTLTQIGIRSQDIVVLGTDHDISVEKEQEEIDKNTSDEPLLIRELQPNGAKPQDYYGTEYNKKLVKNSSSGKGKVPDPPTPAKYVDDNDPAGKKSPLSNQTKKPKVTSFKG